jgi:hypothetical protein
MRRLGRFVLWLLLAELLFFFAIGWRVRSRLERQQRYLGALPAALPGDVVDARAPVLDAREHEQQIG